MNIPKDVLGLAGLFATSGVVHLVKPEVYRPMMPTWVPRHREVILGSGVAELACAAGLMHPRSRKAAGWASAALLVFVFPGNVKVANDVKHSRRTGLKTALFARLPLQVPMIRTALKAARGS